MSHRLDPEIIRRAIDALRVTHPEIAADEETWLLALESETDLHEFLTRVVRRMLEDKAAIIGIDGLIDELQARQARKARSSEAMRALAFKLMQHAELKKLELVPATLSIRTGQPRVIITDEAALPDNVVRIKREPNKTLIRELIDQGVAVNGAELSNSEPSLAMRVK
jgi:hypothetical protein